jgi:hypothetical protein
MLEVAEGLGVDNRTLVKAAALCAKTAIHLCRRKSVCEAAINAALRYANGELDKQDIFATHLEAMAAIVNSFFEVATGTEQEYAATSAVYGVLFLKYLHTAAERAASAYGGQGEPVDDYGNSAGWHENMRKTADICREVLTEAVFAKVEAA